MLIRPAYMPIAALSPAAAASWTPSLLTTKAWWDAADGATLTIVSGKISAWADKSGNGYTASQGTAGNRPAYDATGINGQPAILYTANPQTLTASTLSAAANVSTHYAAVRIDSVAAYRPILYSDAAAGYALRFTSTNGYLVLESAAAHTIGTATSSNLGTLPYVAVVGCVYDQPSGAFSLYVNGTLTGSGTDTYGFAGSTGVEIGWDGGGSFNGEIGEIVRCDSTLGTTDRQKLEGYLAWKWGAQATLPGGHPYASAPP